jgi:hypothetical protein
MAIWAGVEAAPGEAGMHGGRFDGQSDSGEGAISVSQVPGQVIG